jgi:type IV secretion system protein VirB10
MAFLHPNSNHRLAKQSLPFAILESEFRLSLGAFDTSIFMRTNLERGMSLRVGVLSVSIVLSLVAGVPGVALSQTSQAAGNAPAQPPTALPAAPPGNSPSNVEPAGTQSSVAEKKKYTVPAGTKVLLQLRSAINTRSAKPGDGVYLASTFPVVVGNRVMIPAGVYVQGVVDRVARAGRVKGRAQLDMHFTSIIFPNGTVVEIPGMVNSLPGAKKQSVKDDGEGTVEQAGDKGRNAGEVAKIAIPTGGTVGSIGGLESGHPLAGGIAGIGAGLAAAGLVSLFTRGADVNIENGAQVEMVLQRPLILEEENVAGGTAPGALPALVPVADQPRPIEKPNRVHVLCPPGGLGCE